MDSGIAFMRTGMVDFHRRKELAKGKKEKRKSKIEKNDDRDSIQMVYAARKYC